MEEFNHKFAYCNSEYSDVYSMKYIFNNDKIINQNTILNEKKFDTKTKA